jgi:S1-C subfamily serine protease
MRFWTLMLLVFGLIGSGDVNGQQPKTRDQLVRDDLQTILRDGYWIYNDFAKARAEAEQTGKPLLVVIRCIPCEACAQLDSEIMERDPSVRKLMGQYVCLRIVHANGLDLELFQYDYDQSFAAMLMNADKTIYGRYGTRSHQTESADDVALDGFAKALQAGLELHSQYPQNRAALIGKQSQVRPPFATPEAFPQLREKFASKLNYEGNVAQSCIHCHQVGEVLREHYRSNGQAVPERLLFPYPHPKSLGLIMDPHEMATVKSVQTDSPAERDGFLAGDVLLTMANQPLISIADMQWVLHHAPDQAEIPLRILRAGKEISTKLTLEPGWRRRDNLSWRATSWALRRMTTGGLLLEELSAEQRQQAGLPADTMGLFVKHVGQYGAHALAKQTGFQQGDIIVAVDGRQNLMRESDLVAHLMETKAIGDEVPFVVQRKDGRHELKLRMQE